MAASRNRRKNGKSHKEVINNRRRRIAHKKIVEFHKNRKEYESFIKMQQQYLEETGQVPDSVKQNKDEEE